MKCGRKVRQQKKKQANKPQAKKYTSVQPTKQIRPQIKPTQTVQPNNQVKPQTSLAKASTTPTILTQKQIVHYQPFWQHYHYTNYYPFYPFYWYFADHFYSHFPFYYSYYLHYHPSIIQTFSGPLLFEDNTEIDAEANGITVFEEMKGKASTLKQCRNGPQYKFSAETKNGKKFRVFIGNVNDFFNIECVYMMSAIVSIGDVDYSEYLLKMYDQPAKNVSLLDQSSVVKVNPFANRVFRPYQASVKQVTKTVRNLSFKIGIDKLAFADKNLVFYHSNDSSLKRSTAVLNDLAKYAPSGNVLFVLDQFNSGSVKVYRSLVHYYTGLRVSVPIVYRNVYYHLHHHAHPRRSS